MTTHLTERHARSYKIGLLFGWFGRILDKILAYLVSSRGRAPLAIRYPLGKAFLLEIRNFFGRIEVLYSKCVWAGVSLGPCYQQTTSGCLLPNIQTIENTRRIEQLKATYPWTTLIDQHILLVTRNDQEQSTTLDSASCILKRTRSSHQCSFSSPIPSAPTLSPSQREGNGFNTDCHGNVTSPGGFFTIWIQHSQDGQTKNLLLRHSKTLPSSFLRPI